MIVPHVGWGDVCRRASRCSTARQDDTLLRRPGTKVIVEFSGGRPPHTSTTTLVGRRAADKAVLRLGCGEDNTTLRDYYARHGFQTVGHGDFAGRWYSVVLLEKQLRGSDAA